MDNIRLYGFQVLAMIASSLIEINLSFYILDHEVFEDNQPIENIKQLPGIN